MHWKVANKKKKNYIRIILTYKLKNNFYSFESLI